MCWWTNQGEYLTDIDRYGILTGVRDPTELEEKEQKELSL